MAKKDPDNYGREGAPLFSYGLITIVFIVIVVLGLYYAVVSGVNIPRSIPLLDMTLIVIATHKLAWLISKDVVLSFIRAPFVRFQEWMSPGAALYETGRGEGMQKAVGELLACPWCIGMWIAAAFIISYLFLPDITRVIALIFTVLMMSDFLHILFIKAGKWME